MAEGTASKSPLELLKQKVGPLPLGVWLVAAVGIWWYLQKKQAASSSAAPNQQTDPAGNIGSIDPATGYVYGTPEDTASLAANNAGAGGSTGSAGQNATTGGQTFADNNAWGRAALNYLVGLGLDPTAANQAIQNYLSSQPLTSAEQGDVNLAIQGLGAPPSLPGPVSSNPVPVTVTGSGGTTGSTGGSSTGSSGSTGGTTTGGGSGSTGGGASGGTQTSTVSNGRVVSLNNNEAVIAWDHQGPASSWRVSRLGPGGTQVNIVGIPQATYGGLSAGHNYEVTIQPLPTGQPGQIDFKTTSGPGH